MKSILLALACFRNTPQIELEFSPMSSISLPEGDSDESGDYIIL